MTGARTRTRADAVRNFERVLKAAAEVLAEKGSDAAVPEIAARAGVGKGTVYRCFPTKEHLVSAVLAERVRGFTRQIDAAAEQPDAWAAFNAMLDGWAAQQASDCTFAEGLAQDYVVAEMREAKAEMYAALERLLARAKAEGRMRADAGADDVRVMFGGMARMLRADGNRDPAAWRRHAALVAAAFRA
jgi:AcrR family transcriptional regulator